MADYGSYTNGTKSRFGSWFNNWHASNDDARSDLWAGSDLFTRADPHRGHVCRPVIIGSDGRARPVIIGCPPMHQHKQATTTVEEENACRAKPVSPRALEYCATGGCKMGFPGGTFRRHESDHAAPEPTSMTDGGWARPSPTGWKLPPEGSLGRATNNIGTAAEYLRGPVGPASGAERARSSPNAWGGPAGAGQWGSSSTALYSEFGGKKAVATIDSREAVKKYGGKFMW